MERSEPGGVHRAGQRPRGAPSHPSTRNIHGQIRVVGILVSRCWGFHACFLGRDDLLAITWSLHSPKMHTQCHTNCEDSERQGEGDGGVRDPIFFQVEFSVKGEGWDQVMVKGSARNGGFDYNPGWSPWHVSTKPCRPPNPLTDNFQTRRSRPPRGQVVERAANPDPCKR